MYILQAGAFAFIVTICFSLLGVNGTRALFIVYFMTSAFWLLVVLAIHCATIHKKGD